jgi:hypothetical protein
MRVGFEPTHLSILEVTKQSLEDNLSLAPVYNKLACWSGYVDTIITVRYRDNLCIGYKSRRTLDRSAISPCS